MLSHRVTLIEFAAGNEGLIIAIEVGCYHRDTPENSTASRFEVTSAATLIHATNFSRHHLPFEVVVRSTGYHFKVVITIRLLSSSTCTEHPRDEVLLLNRMACHVIECTKLMRASFLRRDRQCDCGKCWLAHCGVFRKRSAYWQVQRTRLIVTKTGTEYGEVRGATEYAGILITYLPVSQFLLTLRISTPFY